MSSISQETILAFSTFFPEEVVREIVGMAFEPHPTAMMMKDVEFTECCWDRNNVRNYRDHVNRDVNGYEDECFEVSVRLGIGRGVYFREARRRDTMRPYVLRRRTMLEMDVFDVEGRTYRARRLENNSWRQSVGLPLIPV